MSPEIEDVVTDEVRWLSDSEQAAWRAYLRGNRMLEVAMDKDLQAHGVSISEYEILSVLSEAEGRCRRMSELAADVVQSRSRLTHTANRLEKRGWVARRAVADDGRGVELLLTDKGVAAVLEMAPVHVESVRRHWFDALTPELVEAVGEAMRRVRDDLMAADPTTPEPIPGPGHRSSGRTSS